MAKAKREIPLIKESDLMELKTSQQCDDLIYFIEKRKKNILKYEKDKLITQYKEMTARLKELGIYEDAVAE